ncbi:N-acetylglucosamine-6-phosphate deacetylase [Brevundimonas pondensis]|uniref:N-acetylglucosamine-6-phosphate deacetylase n=1 Tax=Brevundimonas pondensis TaxID=2774189 RepID=A0ABX7SNQ6_9CAUL|nr:N-acetylglucosamine-6-phosphate deacetylase [Brevundimonas pondensis]QTC89336.1 N-acetylglucosamine-6-phosphate deacetylase [Brevundimonas pondensis]
MPTLLHNGPILVDDAFHDDLAVVVEGDRIAAVAPASVLSVAFPEAEIRDLNGARLVPGYIDTQVNGGGGVLFNDAPTLETIARIGAAHRRFGTTGFLPTLISDDLSVIDQAIDAVEQAMLEGVPGVLGIHIEGPFLNVARKGIHDPSKFRTLDDEAVRLLTRMKTGRTLITLAPETTTPDMITALVADGAVVAAGHTDADYPTVRAAMDAGVTGFTHLFNAMSPLTSREPGVVGAALESQTAWCGIIVDGHHVDPVVLKLALRCRPADRFMLVTDAMPSVNAPHLGDGDDHFYLQGRRISVKDGACLDERGVLAGSDLDMAAAVRNARDLLGLDLATAVMMASAAPAAFLGLERKRGRIAPGLAADLVILDEHFTAIETWIDGASLRNGA